MAICSYNGQRIIPAPFVSIAKEYNRASSGEKIGSTFTITVTGNLVAFKGSPDSTGTFYTGSKYPPDARTDPTYNESIDNNARISSLIRKQEAIRELFDDDGQSFQIQGFDGTQPLKCNPRITSISFQDGLWFNITPYTIVLECDIISVNGELIGEDEFTEYIKSATETWQIETDETAENLEIPRMYRINHTVSAQGKNYFNESAVLSPAWEEARKFVLPRLGLDVTKLNSSGVPDFASSNTAYNHIRSENIDELGGSYSVNESWLMASGVAQEDFSITVSNSLQDVNTRVAVQGNITGFEKRDANLNLIAKKYDNANTKWIEVSGLVFNRAQTYSGASLNLTPLSFSLAKNISAGTINYSYEYDTRPPNLITGSKSETITVTDNFDVDVFAAITVLGRTAGPVLQDIGTKQARTRTLSMELVVPIASGTIVERYQASPFISNSGTIQAIVNEARPNYANVFVSDQQAAWDMYTGRASLNITWTFGD